MGWDPDHECPLVKRVITDEQCIETALYAEGDPEYDPLPDAIAVDGYREICLACQYHKD